MIILSVKNPLPDVAAPENAVQPDPPAINQPLILHATQKAGTVQNSSIRIVGVYAVGFLDSILIGRHLNHMLSSLLKSGSCRRSLTPKIFQIDTHTLRRVQPLRR